MADFLSEELYNERSHDRTKKKAQLYDDYITVPPLLKIFILPYFDRPMNKQRLWSTHCRLPVVKSSRLEMTPFLWSRYLVSDIHS